MQRTHRVLVFGSRRKFTSPGDERISHDRRHGRLWARYQKAISDRPILTKSVTAAVAAVLGELVGSALRQPGTTQNLQSRALAVNGAATAMTPSTTERDKGTVLTNRAEPGLVRRAAAFALFGLVVNGPLFHWWYRQLDRLASRWRQSNGTSGNSREIALKIALDRLILTPPYLLVTLFGLRWLQGLGVERSTKEAKSAFRSALLTNWKVWTLAQLVNFKLIPLQYRPIFGNVIAFWWNIYLSLSSTREDSLTMGNKRR